MKPLPDPSRPAGKLRSLPATKTYNRIVTRRELFGLPDVIIKHGRQYRLNEEFGGYVDEGPVEPEAA